MTASATQFVRHYPLSAVAAAFGGGLIVGCLIAHELKTRLHSRDKQSAQKASEGKAYKRAISRWEGEGGAIPSDLNTEMKAILNDMNRRYSVMGKRLAGSADTPEAASERQ